MPKQNVAATYRLPCFYLWLALGLALVLRVSAALYWDCQYAHGGFVYGDSDGYWTLAKHIAQGEPYEYYGRQIFRMPGYPAFLALVMTVFGTSVPILYARIAGAILGTVCVWQTWLIARAVKGEKGGIIAASIAAVYPEFVLISPMILSETLFCSFMLAQIYFWVKCFTSQRWSDAILMGLFAGLATLVKPGWILFTPGALAILGIYRIFTKSGSLKRFCQGLLMYFVATLVLIPWAHRNFQISGHWIFTTLQAGPSLMDGLNPNSVGSSDMSFMPEIYEKFSAKPDGTVANIEQELQINEFTKRTALNWAKSNPQKVLQLAAIKLWRTWRAFPNQSEFSSFSIRTIFAVPYILLWFFSIYYTKWSIQKMDFWLLCILMALYISGIQSLFVGSMRYRLPAMWMLCILASGKNSK